MITISVQPQWAECILCLEHRWLFGCGRYR